MPSMLVDNTSILKQARTEGYEKGYQDGKDLIAQIAQCRSDEDYDRGRRDAREQAPSRFYWFMAGVITAIVFIFIVLTLFMPSAELIVHG